MDRKKNELASILLVYTIGKVHSLAFVVKWVRLVVSRAAELSVVLMVGTES
jgi:hypothetical protein